MGPHREAAGVGDARAPSKGRVRSFQYAADRQWPANEPARQPYVATFSVNDTVSVIVAHRLGKVEAVRRLREGLARTNGQIGAMVAMEQETWRGDTLYFRMRALGQTAAGSIEVLEDALRIDVSLPWLLAKAAKGLLPLLRKETGKLLEKQ